jgi:hypothetical protein
MDVLSQSKSERKVLFAFTSWSTRQWRRMGELRHSSTSLHHYTGERRVVTFKGLTLTKTECKILKKIYQLGNNELWFFKGMCAHCHELVSSANYCHLRWEAWLTTTTWGSEVGSGSYLDTYNTLLQITVTLRPIRRFLQGPHGGTSQTTVLFIVTVLKT